MSRIWSFRRKNGNHDEGGGTAVADTPAAGPPAPDRTPAQDYPGTTEELLAEITELTAQTRADRTRENERRLIQLRHIAGLRLCDAAEPDPEHPRPDYTRLPEVQGLPEIAAKDVTPELLRAGILRDGALLIRGLVDREDALRFAEQINRAFEERERHDTGQPVTPGYYAEFTPHERYNAELGRSWVKEGGGVLASDSPMLSFDMIEMFRARGITNLASKYLGEPALSSLQKTTLRKADPWVGGAWHQDGAFMGPVRSLNLWLSLSRCGDESPGLDVVPRRLDYLVTTKTEEAVFDMQVSAKKAEEAAGDRPIIRPIFEPGDALFFDELFLHATGSDPSMPKPRFAIESWFFGGSAFPKDYAPILV